MIVDLAVLTAVFALGLFLGYDLRDRRDALRWIPWCKCGLLYSDANIDDVAGVTHVRWDQGSCCPTREFIEPGADR